MKNVQHELHKILEKKTMFYLNQEQKIQMGQFTSLQPMEAWQISARRFGYTRARRYVLIIYLLFANIIMFTHVHAPNGVARLSKNWNPMKILLSNIF